MNDKKIVFEIKDSLCIINDINKKFTLTIDINGEWTFSAKNDPDITSDCTGHDLLLLIKDAILNLPRKKFK